MFHGKNIAISLFSHFFTLVPTEVTFTISIIRYGFGLSLPSSTAKHFRVNPDCDFSIYKYREAGSTIAMILPRCHFPARMKNNQHKIFQITNFIVIYIL